jgi:hypothetical protein
VDPLLLRQSPSWNFIRSSSNALGVWGDAVVASASGANTPAARRGGFHRMFLSLARCAAEALRVFRGGSAADQFVGLQIAAGGNSVFTQA